MLDIAVRYLHFLAIFAMFALLTCEHLLLKGRIEALDLKRLVIIDAAFGVAALATLLCGLGLWFWVGKPAGFYSHNWVFHTKITLFVIAGLISIMPTVFIIKARKHKVAVTVPKRIVMCVRIELLILCVIPLLAVIMANGMGYTQ